MWNHFLFRHISLSSTLSVCSVVCYASKTILCPVVPFSAGNDGASWRLSRGGYQFRYRAGRMAELRKTTWLLVCEGSGVAQDWKMPEEAATCLSSDDFHHH